EEEDIVEPVVRHERQRPDCRNQEEGRHGLYPRQLCPGQRPWQPRPLAWGRGQRDTSATRIFPRRTAPMPYQEILYDKAGHVATITLNRPNSLNAITPRMTEELHQALDVADADADVRAIVLTGAGRAFSAGYAIGPRPDGGSPLDARGVEVAE